MLNMLTHVFLFIFVCAVSEFFRSCFRDIFIKIENCMAWYIERRTGMKIQTEMNDIYLYLTLTY